MKTLLWAAAAVLAACPTANADPLQPSVAVYAAKQATAVCATLADYPTIAGVAGIAEGIIEDGFTGYQAGQIIAIAVESRCPLYEPLLERFADSYAPQVSA